MGWLGAGTIAVHACKRSSAIRQAIILLGPRRTAARYRLAPCKVWRGKIFVQAYVWYRELKEVNKGATLMFANMISLSGKK